MLERLWIGKRLGSQSACVAGQGPPWNHLDKAQVPKARAGVQEPLAGPASPLELAGAVRLDLLGLDFAPFQFPWNWRTEEVGSGSTSFLVCP